MNSDLTPYCQPGPSTSKIENEQPPTNADEQIHFPPYHYKIESAEPPTSVRPPLDYSLTLPVCSFPTYMSTMAVNAVQPSSIIYPSTSSLRPPPTGQIPPDCLDWTINPIKAPPQKFETTSEPLFTLGLSSTISENWMEDDKGLQFSIKMFTFSAKRTSNLNEAGSAPINQYDSLLISIPQALEGDYHYYVWPASPLLAWIMWEHRLELPGKRILEIGSGTSLPGIVAAKCGAIVTLTDDPTKPGTIKHIQTCCYMNGLYPEQIRVQGLSWGLFLLNQLEKIGPIDLIIGSDCFYEENVYEDTIVTVSYLIEKNPLAKFITTYHERDPNFKLEELADKWKLNCVFKSIEDLGQDNGLDVYELLKGNNVYLIEFTKKKRKKNKTSC